jgi:poly-gamma-glutamate capsule biosynthesis protein CapA/YwtB (metallophosphatase superfamily)
VAPLLKRAPIGLGNLEGPLAREAEKHERNYSYRVHPKMAKALPRAGINVVTLANNHLLDCGREGVLETLEALADAGVATIGAGVDKLTAHAPCLLPAGLYRVGLLGYYWNRRTSARGKLPGSAMDPPEDLAADIGALRKQVERVVVTFHWGVPYVREPSPEDRTKARFAIDCGADAVIGHHPHIVQPFEVYRGRPIFFSIGNFTFGSGNSRGESLLLGLRFEEKQTFVYVYAVYVKNRDPRVNYQPKILRGNGAERLLRKLGEISGSNARFMKVENGRGVLELPRPGDACEKGLSRNV